MNQKALICFYIAVPVFCLAVYLQGFFPLKSTIPGHAELQNFTLNDKILSTPPQQFDKLVIILIDALRADFILKRENNNMSHVTEMIRDGRGIVFDVKAHPPTVTLPRIKALTTGTIPGFVDVVLNFDSSSLEEDNLLYQMKRAGKQLVFYGDDTWLKLFPDHFVRSDGTTSFFVSDYTEVDDNVTRHLDSELSTPDWDLMILHYLGLDHIGHLEGPYSPLVAPKLQEMDDVINRIYTALEKQSARSLILVCGDHGMSDHGGHGGASDKETMVPALFISQQFENKGHLISTKHNRSPLQIDLAPTLSVLMGLPIPNNNLGQVLQGALEAGGLGVEAILDVLYINSLQIVQLMEANVLSYKSERSYQMFLDTVNLHKEFLAQSDRSEGDIKQLLYLYETTLEALADRISSSLTDYDMYQLVIAPVVMLTASVAVMLMIIRTGTFIALPLSLNFSLAVPALGYALWHLMACSSTSFHSKTMCGFNMMLTLVHSGMVIMLTGAVACMKATLNRKSNSAREWYPNTMVTKFLLAGSILHSLTYVSSSNIEEEHQTCYFLVTTFFCLNSVQTIVVFSQNYYRQKLILATKSFKEVTSFLHDHIEHKETRTCACGEITYEEAKAQEDFGIFPNDPDAVRKRFNEIVKDKSETGFTDDKCSDSEIAHHATTSNNDRKGSALKTKTVPKIDFPTGELLSLLAVLVILRFLRSLNQTGNKWLDRPDIGDWLNKPESKLVLSIVVLVTLLVLWFIVARKYSFGDVMMAGLPLLSCYRYRAKTGVIEDFLNQIATVDKKYIGTIQFMIVYGIGFIMIFRSALTWIMIKITKITDEKIKIQTIISIIESVQQTLLLMMAILLRTHNILYVVGLGFIEMVIEELVPGIISLPVPYLTMVCLWLGRASFFYQGNSNSLSSIDVAAGYAGLPHYQATIVSIQLFLTTYAGPIFWFIVLLKYIYLRSLRCDTETESLSSRIRKALSLAIMTLVLERLFTLLLYTTVTTIERYHLFVWTVFSPKLLFEGMFTLLSAMVSLIYVSLL